MKNVKKIAESILKNAQKIKVVVTDFEQKKSKEKQIKQLAKMYDGKFIDWIEKDYGVQSIWEFATSYDVDNFIYNVKKLKKVNVDRE